MRYRLDYLTDKQKTWVCALLRVRSVEDEWFEDDKKILDDIQKKLRSLD